jgi:hypothetical protein
MKRTAFISTATGTAVGLTGLAATGVVAENQVQSNFTMREARAQITGIIAELQTEQTDYGGHRVNAINDYKAALDEINAAIKVRDADTPGQRSSDYVLRQAQNQTNSLVASLQAALADYGGHRIKAIADLKAAVAELSAALALK